MHAYQQNPTALNTPCSLIHVVGEMFFSFILTQTYIPLTCRMLTRSATKGLRRVDYARHTLHSSTKPRERPVQYGQSSGRPKKKSTRRKRKFSGNRHTRKKRHARKAKVVVGISKCVDGGQGLFAKIDISEGDVISRYDGLHVVLFVGSDHLEDSFKSVGSPEYIVGTGHTVIHHTCLSTYFLSTIH
jgi:hypothetical protein